MFGSERSILQSFLEEQQYALPYAAFAITMVQVISGSLMCKWIYNKGSTKKIPSYQFVAGIILAILIHHAARIVHNRAALLVSFISIVVNTAYVLFYYIWSRQKERKKLRKMISLGGALIGPFLIYMEMGNNTVTANQGLVVVSVCFFVVFTLISVKPPLKTKRIREYFLPFPLVLSAIFAGIIWILNGVSMDAPMTITQTTSVALIAGIQLALFLVMFPYLNLKSGKHVFKKK